MKLMEKMNNLPETNQMSVKEYLNIEATVPTTDTLTKEEGYEVSMRRVCLFQTSQRTE